MASWRSNLAPLRSVAARHTVGLADPLTAAEIPPDERLDDGLPQALDECIATYGFRFFKLKLSGRIEADVPRLVRIGEVLARRAPAGYAFTLDGNEQFRDLASFRAAWEAIATAATTPSSLRVPANPSTATPAATGIIQTRYR